MGRKSRKKQNQEGEASPTFYPTKQQERALDNFRPKNESQSKYINEIKSKKLVFAIGSAGSGKTYCCSAMAAKAYDNKTIRKIIITRPVVEAGEELGFLPGELDDKYKPYLMPFMDSFEELLGKSTVDYMIKHQHLEPRPLAYMRGTTFKNAFVILDEAQNTTPTQMRMFLTRIGENCTVIVNGDIKQSDIRGESGLEDAIKRVSHIPQVGLVKFSPEDIVRSGLAQEICEAYES